MAGITCISMEATGDPERFRCDFIIGNTIADAVAVSNLPTMTTKKEVIVPANRAREIYAVEGSTASTRDGLVLKILESSNTYEDYEG